MKTGLVLEGGAMRGLFTAGVLDVLLQYGITFDGMIGVSAGAAFGCNFKSRQKGRVLRYNLEYAHDPRYCSVRSFLKTGDLFGVDFCYRLLPDELDLFDYDTFRKNPMEFHVVATDVDTGRALYRKLDRLDREEYKWLQASATMPIVSNVVETNGYRLYDGGISDPIPLNYFQSIGFDRCVVVLTQPLDFQMPPLGEGLQWKIPLQKKYPHIYKALHDRYLGYNRRLEEIRKQEEKGEVFVFRPNKLIDVHRIEHNEKRLYAAWKMGQDEAVKNLEKLKEFLAK